MALVSPVSADECSDYRAAYVLHEATRAVRRSLEDEAGVRAIDAVAAAWEALEVAFRSERELGGRVSDAAFKAGRTVADMGPHYGRAFWELNEVSRAVIAACFHALHFACRELPPEC